MFKRVIAPNLGMSTNVDHQYVTICFRFDAQDEDSGIVVKFDNSAYLSTPDAENTKLMTPTNKAFCGAVHHILRVDLQANVAGVRNEKLAYNNYQSGHITVHCNANGKCHILPVRTYYCAL